MYPFVIARYCGVELLLQQPDQEFIGHIGALRIEYCYESLKMFQVC
jgi:hypothetical protein